MSAGPALAHKGSDAYLDVQQSADAASVPAAQAGLAPRELRFVLSVAIKDLDLLLPIDANADARVTWGEAKTALPLVLALVNESANLEPPPGPRPSGVGGAPECRLDWRGDGVERRGDGAYFRLVAQTGCRATQALEFRYTLFKDQDSTHRLLVAGRIAGKDVLTTTSPQQASSLLLYAGAAAGSGVATGTPTTQATQATQATEATRGSGRWAALRDYFGLGMQHLLQGYDHLAFLLALVLPLRLGLGRNARPALVAAAKSDGGEAGAVANRDERAGAAAVAGPGTAGATRASARVGSGSEWWALLRTVTAFTIGHSITLMLATFGWTQASPRWVEPVIALSIAVTALLNLRPVPWVRTDVLALLFGLVHGFGFAGLLLEAAAPSGLLPWALAGFNFGVEAGQLIAVGGWVLLSQPVVGKTWYPNAVVRGGSVLLVLLAAWWFVERVGWTA